MPAPDATDPARTPAPHDSALSSISRALLTTFGLGHMPIASGTFGSVPPAAVAWLLILAGLGPGDGASAALLYHAVLIAVLILFSAATILRGDAAEATWGRDPSQVVADETAGMCIPLLLLPGWAIDTFWEASAVIASAFLVFRAFDIFKPWPAGRLQNLPAGWGILADDLAAGAMALAVMQITLRAF